jgi:hypothetical protein
MEGLPDDDEDSRSGFRLAVIAVVIFATVLIVAIVYSSVRIAFGPVMARYYHSSHR